MKRLDLPNRLTAFLLAAVIGISAAFCLSSAYNFQLDFGKVILLCLFFAALGAFFCYNRPTLVIGGIIVVMAARQLWLSGLEQHTEAVLYYISKMLHQSYRTGYLIWWSGSTPSMADTTAFFMAAGALVAFVSSWAIAKNRSLPALFAPLPLLLPGLVITDMAPKPIWLVALLCGLLTVYLSRRIRLHNPENCLRLTLRGGLCVVLILAVLCGIFPPDTYEAPDLSAVDQWLQNMLTTTDPTAPTLPWLPPVTSPPVIGPGPSISSTVDLRKVGYQSFSQRYAFQITCTETGWQYLRQQHYGSYSGVSWTRHQSEEDFDAARAFLSGQDQTVELILHTANAWTQLTPYYSASTLVDGRVPASGAERYSVTYQPLALNWDALWQSTRGGTIAQQIWGVDDVYLSLPDSTREGAQAYLNQIGLREDMSVTQVAGLIGSYVRRSAKYNLTTPRMPEELDDFALWFLEESDRGYCVHFASAATVLLRAAGIPARYVEGYLIDTTANVQRMVYQGNAHAWVEYYLPGLGWVILEATPGSTGPEPTDPPPTTTPTGPTPPETTVPPTTKPDKPTLPPPITTPTDPSIPETQPTEPTPGPDPVIDLSWLWPLLQGAGQVALILAFVIGQWKLRLRWLMHRLHKGSEKDQALARWRHSKWLARLRKETAPRELLELANKAKFSQHILTRQELRQFDLYRAETVAALRRRNVLMRFVYRIILAIY